MTEKLQNQSSQPTQSRFDQFKCWLNRTQTENADKNLEIAATGQTPLKRALAKVEDFVNGESCASDELKQDLIDYRYEAARLQRKAEREAKGQTFEQAVLEDVAKKELKKKQNVEATTVSPLEQSKETLISPSKQTEKKPKTTNSPLTRLKAWGALAILSGSMMMAPNALANNNSNSKVENNHPTKVEQVKSSEKTTDDKTTSAQDTNEQQIKQIEQLIAGKGVNNGGIKAGLSIKGLEARFQARAKHNGESQAKIQYIVKGQVEAAKQLIKQGQSETVAYILTSLESDNAKAQKATDEFKKQLSDERIYKDAIAGLNKKEVKVKRILVNIEGGNIDFNDEKTTKINSKYITDPDLIAQIRANKRGYITPCSKRNYYYKIKTDSSCKDTIVTFEGKKYYSIYSYTYNSEVYHLYPFDPSKPETIINYSPELYIDRDDVPLLKVKYKGSEMYFRPSTSKGLLFEMLNKYPSIIIEGLLASENDDTSMVRLNLPNKLYKKMVISKNWFGQIEVQDYNSNFRNLNGIGPNDNTIEQIRKIPWQS
jgi:hypothetical protein